MDIEKLNKINKILNRLMLYFFLAYLYILISFSVPLVFKMQWNEQFDSLVEASEQYIEENDGEYPTDINQLFPYTDFYGDEEVESKFSIKHGIMHSVFAPKGIFPPLKVFSEKSYEFETKKSWNSDFDWSGYLYYDEDNSEIFIFFIENIEMFLKVIIILHLNYVTLVFTMIILPIIKFFIFLMRKSKRFNNKVALRKAKLKKIHRKKMQTKRVRFIYKNYIFIKEKSISVLKKLITINNISMLNKILNILIINFFLVSFYSLSGDFHFSPYIDNYSLGQHFDSLISASDKYIEEHDGEYPTDITELFPYTDFYGDSEIENKFFLNENILSYEFATEMNHLFISQKWACEKRFDLETKRKDSHYFDWSEYMEKKSAPEIQIVYVKTLEKISDAMTNYYFYYEYKPLKILIVLRIVPLLAFLMYKDKVARKSRNF